MWVVTVADPMEVVDQDYVLVSSPPMDASSSPSISKLSNFPCKSGSPLQHAGSPNPTSTAPMPIIGAATGNIGRIDSFESRSSAPGTSQGSTDMVDTIEQPSTDCITRIKSLQRCASAITELVNEKVTCYFIVIQGSRKACRKCILRLSYKCLENKKRTCLAVHMLVQLVFSF